MVNVVVVSMCRQHAPAGAGYNPEESSGAAPVTG